MGDLSLLNRCERCHAWITPSIDKRHEKAHALVCPNKNPHAVAMGQITSEKRAEASRENGRSGGRPITPEGFWAKVDQPESGCWFLRRRTHKDEYQQIGGKQAHRLAYEFTHGPIPAGFVVCHRCDMPGCVNPSHLFAGTHDDNAEDREQKQRGRHDRRATKLCIYSSDDLWLPFWTRANRENLSPKWLLEELIRRYVAHGLDRGAKSDIDALTVPPATRRP